jgi:hypothetical protein
MSYLVSQQEEADTKLLLHAIDATHNGTTDIKLFSPDTDVFVLALRRYPELCANISFVTGVCNRRRIIPLQPIIVKVLGPSKLAALDLPAFHAISGADNTGSFSGKVKLTCWKAFEQSEDDILTAMASLGTSETPAEEAFQRIEKFICNIYLPGTDRYVKSG